MARSIAFPPDLKAGTLFHAERCYCLDDSLFDWLSDAQGAITVPDDDFIGIVFAENIPLRREVLQNLDSTIIQLVYFRNPFELQSLMEVALSEVTAPKIDLSPTDEECKLIARLQGLRALDLAGAHITDEGLADVCSVRSLESLVICDTGITDDGMKHIANLTELRELDISLNVISMESLKYVSKLKHLEELRISDTAIDDDALPYLEQLTSLKFLDLADTAFSEEGLDKLRAKLPDCDVWP